MSSVPREVLRDVLHPLNRRTLDAVQFTNRRFLQTILEQMSDVCLRQIVAASFKAANPNENTYATWFIHIRGRPGFPDRKIQSSHEDAARLFWEFLQALRSSRVTRLTFNGKYFEGVGREIRLQSAYLGVVAIQISNSKDKKNEPKAKLCA